MRDCGLSLNLVVLDAGICEGSICGSFRWIEAWDILIEPTSARVVNCEIG